MTKMGVLPLAAPYLRRWRRFQQRYGIERELPRCLSERRHASPDPQHSVRVSKADQPRGASSFASHLQTRFLTGPARVGPAILSAARINLHRERSRLARNFSGLRNFCAHSSFRFGPRLSKPPAGAFCSSASRHASLSRKATTEDLSRPSPYSVGFLLMRNFRGWGAAVRRQFRVEIISLNKGMYSRQRRYLTAGLLTFAG